MLYLDHAAATPLSQKAFNAMQLYFSEQFFNPSAAYLPAVEVRHAYEKAKDDIAHVIGAKGVDLVMTSGATESVSLAFSLVGPDAEVITSAVEHPAVRENAKRAELAHEVKVNSVGRVDLDDFCAKLSPRTQFVSICLVSSELGTIQPISDIARIISEERHRRAMNGETTPLYFHCDASQGIGQLEVKINRLGVDLLTLNAAKVYGPKGIGALYVGHNVRLKPQTVGGGQEMGLRSGTENVPAVIAPSASACKTSRINSAKILPTCQILNSWAMIKFSCQVSCRFLCRASMRSVSFLRSKIATSIFRLALLVQLAKASNRQHCALLVLMTGILRALFASLWAS